MSHTRFLTTVLVCASFLSSVLLSLVPAGVQASFSGTNGRLIFSENVSTGVYQIVSTAADGTGAVQLTTAGTLNDSPRWSPDGTKIVFYSNRDGDNEIFTMNADGSAQTQLTFNSSNDQTPVWSPDGTKIAFISNSPGNNDIFTMNADGTNITNITNNSANDTGPDWSSTNKIAMASTRTGNFEIYSMNPDGSNVTQLTNDPDLDLYPSWSPDGSKLVFSSNRSGNYNVYRIQSDGSAITQITSNIGSELYPVWSPDSAYVLYTRAAIVYRINIDGSSETALYTNGNLVVSPDWQPIRIVSTASSSGGSTNTTSTPQCVMGISSYAPELFQITAHTSSATLYFVPPSSGVNKFYIAYGLSPGSEQYGVEFPQNDLKGVVSYTINALAPNTRYYFKVRGGHGCMSGTWGNNLSGVTAASVKSYYLH